MLWWKQTPAFPQKRLLRPLVVERGISLELEKLGMSGVTSSCKLASPQFKPASDFDMDDGGPSQTTCTIRTVVYLLFVVQTWAGRGGGGGMLGHWGGDLAAGACPIGWEGGRRVDEEVNRAVWGVNSWITESLGFSVQGHGALLGDTSFTGSASCHVARIPSC